MFNDSATILAIFFMLLVVTLMAILGAFFSRELNFDYSRLSLVSFAFYVFTAYFILHRHNLGITIIWMGLVGLYDGTVGWYLALKMNARISSIDVVKKLPSYVTATIGFLFGAVTALLCAGAKYVSGKI